MEQILYLRTDPLWEWSIKFKKELLLPLKVYLFTFSLQLKIQLTFVTFVCPELRCGYVFNLLPSKKYVFVSSSMLQWNMKSFYNGSTLKERFCSKGILRIKNHSEWSKNQKKQSSFTCSSKLMVTFVCPEVACGVQLKIDKLQKLFSNLQILGEYLKIVF